MCVTSDFPPDVSQLDMETHRASTGGSVLMSSCSPGVDEMEDGSAEDATAMEVSQEGRASANGATQHHHQNQLASTGGRGDGGGGRGNEVTPVLYCEEDQWCQISYYEYGLRIGDTYHCTSSSVVVDGYTDPHSPERFCLGILSNVQRDRSCEMARRHIGQSVAPALCVSSTLR